jgi:hypothetical protein
MRRRGALSGTPLSCPRTKGFVFEPRSAVRCRARHARAMLAPGSSCDHEDPGARDDPRPRPPRRAARRAGAAGGKIPRVGFIVMARKGRCGEQFSARPARPWLSAGTHREPQMLGLQTRGLTRLPSGTARSARRPGPRSPGRGYMCGSLDRPEPFGISTRATLRRSRSRSRPHSRPPRTTLRP